ncbi:MAG: hypothetical protein Q7S47_00850 [bacterium]|nr:hypothetical protein [bacterium]
MVEYKIVVSVLVVALTCLGYSRYILDTIKGKTIPHAFTWFIWALAGFLVYGMQVGGGAGVGAWVTLFIAVMCSVIFLLGLWSKDRDITRSDVVFFILSFCALILWLVVKQPMWSMILIVGVDLLGFVPTIRKAWKAPHTETLFYFELNVVKFGLSILALQEYNIVTWLFPVAWACADFLFSLMLIVRRRQLSGSSLSGVARACA